jgi:hypothetical protein
VFTHADLQNPMRQVNVRPHQGVLLAPPHARIQTDLQLREVMGLLSFDDSA